MNKVLVNIYIALLDEELELFIPINKKVGVIKKYITQFLSEEKGIQIEKLNELRLYNRENSMLIDNNLYIKGSGIQNGSKLFLL